MASNLQHVQGLDGLLDALKALPPEIASKNGGPARAALAKGAKIIRDDARIRAPKDTGATAANIVMKRDGRPDRFGVNERYTVGVRGGSLSTYSNTKRNRRKGVVGKKYEKQSSTYYWRFKEFGTEKMAATPFMRPAFESNQARAMAAITDTLAKGIERAAKKVSRGR
jgi:HK97 gp10 family phage protein